jgi:hypothetical protein
MRNIRPRISRSIPQVVRKTGLTGFFAPESELKTKLTGQ